MYELNTSEPFLLASFFSTLLRSVVGGVEVELPWTGEGHTFNYVWNTKEINLNKNWRFVELYIHIKKFYACLWDLENP